MSEAQDRENHEDPDVIHEVVGRAILRAIPYVGPPLEEILWGPARETRQKRFEEDVREVLRQLKERAGLDEPRDRDNFVNLAEDIGPALARSTESNRREYFRRLLLNAGQLPPGDSNWHEASLAGKLLGDIEPPGLAILAGLARSTMIESVLTLAARCSIQPGDVGPNRPLGEAIVLPYSAPVIEEWARRLRDMRLLDWGSSMTSQVPDGVNGHAGVRLTALGQLLVRWAISDEHESGPKTYRVL